MQISRLASLARDDRGGCVTPRPHRGVILHTKKRHVRYSMLDARYAFTRIEKLESSIEGGEPLWT